ncbi:MAG: rod shape-determining protein MreD [Alphaproteobacteria bacterium]|nr:rod shape-determining protein MreD [Alphaproteobacteria bacterium]
MLTTFAQRLEQNVRQFLPLASTLLFVLMGAVAWPLPFIGAVSPSLGLVAVYYWSIHRPDLFRPLPAFAAGLMHDVLHFLPPGLTALVFVAVHQLVLRQRRFFVGQTFFMLWAGFALIMLIVMVVEWLILSAFDGRWMAFLPVLLQGLLTIAIFPLPAWLLIRLQRAVLRQG